MTGGTDTGHLDNTRGRGGSNGGASYQDHGSTPGRGGGSSGSSYQDHSSTRGRGRSGASYRGRGGAHSNNYAEKTYPDWQCPDPECDTTNPGCFERCTKCRLCQAEDEWFDVYPDPDEESETGAAAATS